MIGGFGLLAARVVIPTCVSVLLGNALLLLGLLQMLAWPLHRRTAVLSAAHIALLAPAASGHRPPGLAVRQSPRTVALSISAAIVAHAVRVVHAWTVLTTTRICCRPA